MEEQAEYKSEKDGELAVCVDEGVSRWDVVYTQNNCYIEPHFCRDFDENGEGCFGFNPEHGYTWGEAKDEIIKWHLQQAEEWKKKLESDY